MEGASDHQKCRIVKNYIQNHKGKNTGNRAQKDEYKAMLNDSSISDLYQHFPAFRKPNVAIPEVPSFRPTGSGKRRHVSMTIGEVEFCLIIQMYYRRTQTIVKAESATYGTTWGYSGYLTGSQVCDESCRVLEVDEVLLRSRENSFTKSL